MKKFVFGIDVGGTSIKFGFFKQNEGLIKKWSIPTDISDNGKNIIYDIAKEVKNCIDEFSLTKGQVKAIGLSVPGPVDESGVVRGCVNIGWDDFDAAKELSGLTDLNCVSINDANAAGLGEALHGVAKGCRSAVMLTIGTGVGGAVIIDGMPIMGKRGNAGEIGHFKVNIDETEYCSCKKKGCLEFYASATGIKRFAKRNTEKYGCSALINTDSYTVEDMANEAKKGDRLCIDAFENAGKYIGLALSHIAGTVDPDIFILGGGVSEAGDILFTPVKNYFEKYSFGTECEIPIVKAVLGNYAGIFGAAEFAIGKENLID